MTTTQKTNIYEIPEIARLMKAWKATCTSTNTKGDKEAHDALMNAIKLEQAQRGQRTKMSYGKNA